MCRRIFFGSDGSVSKRTWQGAQHFNCWSSCTKTFLIKSLCTIFNNFVNPAKGTFNWVGVEKAEIIFLNDFRWSERIIPWEDMLCLLEGNKTHVPTHPEDTFCSRYLLEKNTPTFCTAPNRICIISNGTFNEIESEMMDVRWKAFQFFHQIKKEDAIDVPLCPKCFADLVMNK